MSESNDIEAEEREWSKLLEGCERKSEFTTYSGIPLKAMYTPLDIKDKNYLEEIGFPGKPPYVRGVHPTMYRGHFWTTRMFSGFSTAEETNERWKMLFKEGQTGFSAAVDSLTQACMDPHDPRVGPEVGTDGVPLYCKPAVAAMVDGIPIDKIGVALVMEDAAATITASMYFNVYKERGYDLKTCMGTTQNDLLSMTIGCLQYRSLDPTHRLKLACDLIEWCTADKNVPRWNPINFTTYNYREGGIDAVQEMAFGFANAIEHIDHLLGRGRKIEEFAGRLAFHLSAHNDFFEEIAKYRASRRVWYKLMKDKYGVTDPRLLAFRFHIQTAGSTLTRQQAMVNSVRIAYQALAASIGGVQSMHTNSYDEALCLPSEEAVLLALRTQQVLKEETNVGSVIDPMGGSYYIEWLTDELENRIWDYLGKIENAGGLVKSLETGWLYKEVTSGFNRRRKMIESGEERIVGINCYTVEEDVPLRVFRTNPDAAKVEIERIDKLKEERDGKKIEDLLSKLRGICEREENVMPIVMELTKEGAINQEICDVYRDVWGEWKANVVF